MGKLTEKIICVDCGNERMVTKACLKLVTRCKSCQKVFNRDRARNRYRELNDIPLDKPIIQRKQAEEAHEPAEAPVSAEQEDAPPERTISPEERKAAVERLIAMTIDKDNDLTTDDW